MAGIRAMTARVIGSGARALGRLRGTARTRRRPGRAGSARVGAGLSRLTDRELVRAWEHSSRDLATDLEATRRLALVITRPHLLDELRERHLDGPPLPPG
ncbi:hypothetical protein EUA93_18280 [Nocardioides oleivorans]|uniref:Uncharacterized protein n=1 Tax=Nocardioides oleivorans TaxID=273676 RepID=A0A4Q2RTU7_9ACTN|nr:hypothetical protein [Nocardioides oleivorans]RYB92046.1 hypothetical protein EUA93_18280 [Nocardioides oleivorans]